jgi:CHAT domain-containing protein
VPHGTFLVERLAEEKATGGAEGSLLAVGAVDYGEPAAAAGKADQARPAAGPAKRLLWPALPGTAKEQQQVAELARRVARRGAVERSGAAATTDQVLRDLPAARFAHFATHGFFTDATFLAAAGLDPASFDMQGAARHPLARSGLALAGANRTGKDAAADHGLLTAESIVGLRLEGMELAVLSACQTGSGGFSPHHVEGICGFQTAFHVAGCKNVITSLWKVDDHATQALMALFYRNMWEKKLDAAEALRQAQLTLYRHPEAVQVAAKRGIDFTESDLPVVQSDASTNRIHAPTAHWAAFTFSGVRRAGERGASAP